MVRVLVKRFTVGDMVKRCRLEIRVGSRGWGMGRVKVMRFGR